MLTCARSFFCVHPSMSTHRLYHGEKTHTVVGWIQPVSRANTRKKIVFPSTQRRFGFQHDRNERSVGYCSRRHTPHNKIPANVEKIPAHIIILCGCCCCCSPLNVRKKNRVAARLWRKHAPYGSQCPWIHIDVVVTADINRFMRLYDTGRLSNDRYRRNISQILYVIL